ncbi:prostaglandin F2 receptor negative regulator-like isoform X1 [Chiloscyllium plagiosum]|uniref:prostaglandin F2 receptor negative regulator-like isoform X1 n=1 Tax=Chiloscyllium plagiosum TaxID=36176 RepID=UPI001CB7EC1F|nr:prostaglandin F2 receptor negative regulator-like isoform X1 [Chiloscyllium plagiosum]XP_043556852.1 prostaglandin F2 receptor negative regulator-like isoform X1 [Chiloscyllium plagiosum]XP_043556853.1 prostaglandin F2 receptor negative regulator-like isoform X1 [Chiloscyllium plagiosum]
MTEKSKCWLRTAWILQWLIIAVFWGLISGRVVKVPLGPLYRIVGTSVTIPCNVSDYQGPAEQNFDWSVTHANKHFRIVSTLEPEFSDAEYKEKIQKKEIWVERVNDYSAELHFKSVKFEDDGRYQCQTPSTDENSSGNYDDSVFLQVIPDGLSVSPRKSRSTVPVTYLEGKPLELQCVARTTSSVSTHLSVTWQLKGNSNKSENLLSFTKDSWIQPGDLYKERYLNGDIRMGFETNGLFKLIITSLRPEDEGVYSCVAAEWVKEDGSNWKLIQEKTTDIAVIEVQQLAQTLNVSAIGQKLTLNKGDEIDLICNVTGVEDTLTVEVSWYFSASAAMHPPSDKVLVSFNRAAVVSGTDFVTLTKISSSEYRLRVQQIDETDSGYYYCTASVWVPYTSESWHQAAEGTSRPIGVDVDILDPTYTVQLKSIKVPSSSGESAELECRVLDLQNADDTKLTVAWYVSPKQLIGTSEVTVPIATMDPDWTLQLFDEYVERAEKGEIIFMKSELHTFKFQMQQALPSDRGKYFCNVTAQIKQRGNTWLKKQEVSSLAIDIDWKTEDPSLSITAIEEKPVSTRGNTFEMICRVSAEHVEVPHYSVAIAMNEPTFMDTQHSKKLISLTRDSVVKLERWDDKDRSEDVVLEKVGGDEFRFRLYRTQFSDEGSYYCIVQAWAPDTNGQWSEIVTNSSNTVVVTFKTAAPQFNVSLQSEKPHVFQGETMEMTCTVDLSDIPNNSDVLYEVEWFVTQQFSNDTSERPLLLIDQRSVVTHLKANSDISVERISMHEFRLRLHCSEKTVAGDYFCKVTPWVKSETGTWQKMPPQRSDSLSVRIDISVLDSFKMPLIYGIGVAILIGILACAIGYCSSRYCCGERITPRYEQHRLISMASD